MNRSSSAISRPPAEIVVPDDLRERDQWVLWRYQERNGKATTKVAYQVIHRPASSTHRNMREQRGRDERVASSAEPVRRPRLCVFR
jgi:hypothetical protein